MAIKRGEIYFVNLNPVQGKEQSGKRPVLVLSIDAINQLPLVVTVFVGTKGKNVTHNYPTNVRPSPRKSICYTLCMTLLTTNYEHIALNEANIALIKGTTMKVIELVSTYLSSGSSFLHSFRQTDDRRKIIWY